MKVLAIFTIAFFAGSLSFAQSKAPFTKIYVGSEGLIHLIDKGGSDAVFPKESDQVAVSDPKLSTDRRAAGWLIEQDNCCTSYSIPTRLAIYVAGKWRLFGDDLMIYDWCFVGGGKQIAMSTGTVHGMVSRHLMLYDVRNGKMLQEWNGDFKAPAPLWGKDLKQ